MEDIYKGAVANDKTGTPARQAADIINQNFAYLEARVNNKDQILVLGTIALVAQNLTLFIGWRWLINGLTYENPADVVVSYPYAASGKRRLDRLVLNTSNTFTRIPGPESVSNPVALPVPANTIDFGVSLVTDNSIGEPSTPIIGESYVKKMESQDFVVSLGVTTVVDHIDLTDDRSSISLNGAITDVKSIQMSGEFIRLGKPFFIKNRTGHDVKLWHLAGSGNVKIFFSNELDLIIKNNEVLQFNQNGNDSSNVRIEFVGFIGIDSYTKIETDAFLDSKADLVSGKVPYFQLPSYVDDVLEGYLQSDVFYLESGHTTIIPAEAGKIYVDLSSGQNNKQYRYSGSTYIQITNGLIASTNDVPEGVTNLYFQTTRVLATILSGLSFATGGSILSTDSILVAFGKIQNNITSIYTALNLKADLESPNFSGTPIVPTASLGTNSTQIASTAFVLANAERSGLNYMNNTLITHTGTTSITKILSLLIPANTLANNNSLDVEWFYSRVVTGSNTVKVPFYINTIDSLSGATLIGYGASLTSAANSASSKRKIIIRGTNKLVSFQSTTAESATDGPIQPIEYTVNLGMDIYVIFAAQLNNSADTIRYESASVSIKRIIP